MTHLEAYELLKTRVEWQRPFDTSFDFLNFKIPFSGRFFQEEHSCVRIPIMYETIVDLDISNEDFQTTLETMKKNVILNMLHDVFYDKSDIKECWITDNSGLFDYAIILKCTSTVIHQILNSSRISNTTKVTKDNIQRWFIDLNGLID